MELYKYLPEASLEELLQLLNTWWVHETLPEELTYANLFDKYRPISLSNSLYKIFAALLKRRLELEMEYKLQSMQFGFRKRRSTPRSCRPRWAHRSFYLPSSSG
eukprot:12934379-Prorocentrum_lima.AAC.1